MILRSFRAKTEFGENVDFCLDPALFGLNQGTVKLEEKIAQLFEILRTPVYQYLVALFADPAEAEDITQEAFLRLYRQLHAGQPVNDARSWIFRVAHNLAVERLAARRHLTTIDASSWDDICELLPDPGLNPEQAFLQGERFERLHAALMLLSPQQRNCLHLRTEGFRYREIAEILHIDISSVEVYLRRGINKLMRQNNE
jgi:RNA polymerase sigma-70 factor (ECF subfamily)